jgi:hypothetical protein
VFSESPEQAVINPTNTGPKAARHNAIENLHRKWIQPWVAGEQ